MDTEFQRVAWQYKDQIQSIQFWDAPGQRRFQPFVRGGYKRPAHVVLLLYCVARRDHFEKLDTYYEEVRQEARPGWLQAIVIVASCQDIELAQHKVTSVEGQEWIRKHTPTVLEGKMIPVCFMEVSAKSGQGVEALKRLLAGIHVELPPL
eukprot:CAMPEP_0168543118 /NCGR_PEP_ID=MMETSP0413-20121227/1716_1 /TAXON_ID=136452 /ORGANISM="Filamoeba nolandi, Strain NC-AS-23-1" /LENGTH=149 /DNA_ID=CAMNT_0008573051 /DNA_START=841 /DNA_END=1290 /DNA_ORIENTATION=+